MKSDQRLKLMSLRRKVDEARKKAEDRKTHLQLIEMNRNMVSATVTATNALLSIKELVVDGIHIENKSDPIDMTPIAASVKELVDTLKLKKQPIVNVHPEIKVTPVVMGEDVYGRYKRVNSAIEPDGTYHGFVDADGNWFIQKETQAGLISRSRYASGKGDFNPQWAKHRSLTYKLFSEVEII